MIQQQEINGETIIPGRHGSALVASHSAEGGWHLVANGQCDCEGYKYRHDCRHVRAVGAYNGLDREAELKAEAAENDQERARPTTYGRTPDAAFETFDDEPDDDGEYMTISEYLERRASGRE